MASLGSSRSRIKGTWYRVSEMTKQRRVKVALAGYAVTITFGVVFIAALALAPKHSPSVALGAAIVVSLPLAIAFIGDKIKSFKGFGIEVETKAAAESLTEISIATIPTTNSDLPYAALSGVDSSGAAAGGEREGLADHVVSLIDSPDSELVKLDLHAGTYWWPSRLYLLAALLNDYTDVKRLVFVQEVAGSRAYSGMSRPAAVARRIALGSPLRLEVAYEEARERAIADVSNGLESPGSFDGERSHVGGTPRTPVDAARVVQFTAAMWQQAVKTVSGIDEIQVKDRVDRSWLENTLRDDWRWAAVDFAGNPDSPLVQHYLLASPEEYTALLTAKRLIGVIGRERLAISIATAYLTRRLDS